VQAIRRSPEAGETRYAPVDTSVRGAEVMMPATHAKPAYNSAHKGKDALADKMLLSEMQSRRMRARAAAFCPLSFRAGRLPMLKTPRVMRVILRVANSYRHTAFHRPTAAPAMLTMMLRRAREAIIRCLLQSASMLRMPRAPPAGAMLDSLKEARCRGAEITYCHQRTPAPRPRSAARRR